MPQLGYQYGLACWVLGVLISFLLPYPYLTVWLVIGVSSFLLYLLLKRDVFICLGLLCLGLSYGVWRTESLLSHQWSLENASKVMSLNITVLSDVEHNDKRARFLAEAKTEDQQQYLFYINDYQRQDWPLGSRWEVNARIRPIIGEVNQVGFNRETWALSHHIDGTATLRDGRVQLTDAKNTAYLALTHWRVKLSQTWSSQEADYPLGVALIQALTIGKQSVLPTSVWQSFSIVGVNHLVSISGLHVGMIAWLVSILFAKLLRFSRLVSVSRPHVYANIMGLFAAFIYTALAGFALPTQRSLLMIAVVVLALCWHRLLSGLRIWLLAMGVVLLFDPVAALSIGFWLSFMLVAALIYVSDGTLRLVKWKQWGYAQWAVSIASCVLLAYFFGSIPIMSPVVNAVAIPWFTLVLIPLSLISMVFSWAPLLRVVSYLAEHTVELLQLIASWAPVYHTAHPPLLALILSILAVMILLLPRGLYLKPWGLLMLMILLFYQPKPVKEGEAKVVILDVGQGLSILIQTAKHSLLFDTGTGYAAQMAVLPNLRAFGIRSLSAMVLSHHDADHDGGSSLIHQSFTPKKTWAGHPSAYIFPVDYCADHVSWEWDGVWFEFLTPTMPHSSVLSKNDQSCVLRVVASDKALLVMGDLGKKGERVLQEKYGDDLYSQVLILGHHGSKTSSDAHFVRQVSPTWAVASSGFANGYGHPNQEVLSLLNSEDVKLLRTDSMGGLQMVLNKEPIRWMALKSNRPYWQRKPWVSPDSVAD